MNIELWLIHQDVTQEKRQLVVDLPAVPRKGDTIIFGDIDNYEVSDVVFRLNDEGLLTRITVDAITRASKSTP